MTRLKRSLTCSWWLTSKKPIYPPPYSGVSRAASGSAPGSFRNSSGGILAYLTGTMNVSYQICAELNTIFSSILPYAHLSHTASNSGLGSPVNSEGCPRVPLNLTRCNSVFISFRTGAVDSINQRLQQCIARFPNTHSKLNCDEDKDHPRLAAASGPGVRLVYEFR